jgi:predicted transcriptional regulator
MKDKFVPKSQDNKKALSVRLEERAINKIDKLATKNNVSRNKMIEQLLDFALERTELEE